MHTPERKSHLRLVPRQLEVPQPNNAVLDNQYNFIRARVGNIVRIALVAAGLSIGGEIAGCGCISTPYQAVSVLRAKSRLTDIAEELMEYRSYALALDAEKFLENPWAVRKKAIEISHILDEAIEAVEDIKKSGARFRPAVLMEAFGVINSTLSHLESDEANDLYARAKKYRKPGWWTRNVTAKFVDIKGISAAGYAGKDIRDKVRKLKKALQELQDSTLDGPTNNRILNIVMGADAAVTAVQYSSASRRFLERTATLQRREKGEEVAEIQRTLIKLHFLGEGGDDGDCGRKTMGAVNRARRTIQLIQQLKMGDKNRNVRELQRNLIHAKCLPSGVDGDYGEKTSAAVERFKYLLSR